MGLVIFCIGLYLLIQVGILLFFKGANAIRKEGVNDETTLFNTNKKR